MCLNIVFEIMYSSLECGFLFRSSSDGGSVAKAKEPKVSMIKLTHNIWMGRRIYCLSEAAPMRVIETATTLTVS